MKSVTVLICTHNRADLLQRAISSLDGAHAPPDWSVEILVIANSCSDSTHRLLERYASGRIACSHPIRWAPEPRPGKSNALNTAIPMLNEGVVAFVDDDHRVDQDYIAAICRVADRNPDVSMFCGRIYPDWDGREPAWVHDEGPYRIRPLPVPRSDNGPDEMEITSEHRLPGGGNLAVRTSLFRRVGGFSTDLGPHGHDLGGGEDTEFLLRARHAGERMVYTPAMIQYHYADPERLETAYLLRKAYHRSRTSADPRPGTPGIPLYMWRKAAAYGARSLFTLGATKRLHFAIRLAATLGEMRAALGSEAPRGSPTAQRNARRTSYLSILAGLLGMAFVSIPPHAHDALVLAIGALLLVTLPLTAALVAKALLDYSQTGPKIAQRIRQQFRPYALRAMAAQSLMAWLLLTLLAAPGVVIQASWVTALGGRPALAGMAFGGAASIVLLLTLQFCRHLLHVPASLVASSHYRMSRFYGLWQRLTPQRIHLADCVLLAVAGMSVLVAAGSAIAHGRLGALPPLLAIVGFYAALGLWLRRPRLPASIDRSPSEDGRPNILMIGADTLRADRLDGSYPRPVAPYLESFAAKGTLFPNCFVPCARTAPSLISLLTGTWPHQHGIRDNYVDDKSTRLTVDTLPALLRREGYRTAAISDWCGADMGKFSFGFDYVDVPPDQWNLRYLLRQGPKDLRLLLSLFARNPVGRSLLPEIYALGGVPTTDDLGEDVRELIDYLAGQSRPFLLNAFLSTTHGPFGSEYPYYKRYADPAYRGESKFAMARVNDPFEIIRRQGEPRTEFDLDQIIDLYDGCVTRFDDEVARIVAHLESRGLAENTIVVIYSDHGMEFFESGTWGQGNSVLGDTSSRTPLLIRDPRKPGQGLCHDVIRSIDLMPTLLELAGIHVSRPTPGRSLNLLLDGKSEPAPRPAFNETGIWLTDLPGTPAGHLRYPPLTDLLDVPDIESATIAIKPEFLERITIAKDRMIRKGRWKMTYQPLESGPLLKLFDVVKDPAYECNVIDRHPEIADDLWQELMNWLREDPVFRNSAPSYPNHHGQDILASQISQNAIRRSS